MFVSAFQCHFGNRETRILQQLITASHADLQGIAADGITVNLLEPLGQFASVEPYLSTEISDSWRRVELLFNYLSRL